MEIYYQYIIFLSKFTCSICAFFLLMSFIEIMHDGKENIGAKNTLNILMALNSVFIILTILASDSIGKSNTSLAVIAMIIQIFLLLEPLVTKTALYIYKHNKNKLFRKTREEEKIINLQLKLIELENKNKFDKIQKLKENLKKRQKIMKKRKKILG